jgi:membrane-bound lytic murein transglycosylase D
MFFRLDEGQRILKEGRRLTQASCRPGRDRRRQLPTCRLTVLGLAVAMLLGAGMAHAQAADTALEQRLRDLEARVAHLEADRERLSRALLTFRVPASFTFAGEQVPLDRWDVHERLEREVLLSLQDRGQVVLWLKRAARYFPYIERMLSREGLPDDLKYVAVIESALLPLALSQANASGIWQFVPATARRYGLRVTSWWDERKDPELATRAALVYLKDLQAEFGSWSLALAAYNCGEARVRSAIKAQGVQSYFQLALPAETERYVFRAYAAKLILAQPERYGFLVPETERYQPPARDRIRFHVRTRLSVRAIAEASGSFYREVKQLNPAITRDALPAGVYALNLPEGAGESFRPREARPAQASGTGRTHRVQRGDTLSAIARRYGISLALLRQRNPALRGGLIHPGDVLIVR